MNAGVSSAEVVGQQAVGERPQRLTPDLSRLWESDGVALKRQRGPWKVDFAGVAIHVRPRADLWWHPLDVGCWCDPVENTDAPAGVVMRAYLHNAADGRSRPVHTASS